MAKRHHYLPQFYLQQFLSKKGGFVVYDKKTGQRRPQTPINTGVEGHLYTQLDAEGKPTDFIEEEMLSPHDGHVAPILEKWLEPDASPTDGDVEVMASFLAFMNTRVPRNIEMVREFGRLFAVHRSRKMDEDQERLESFLKHYHDGHPADPMTLEEVQALLRDPEKSVKISVERRAAVILSLRATADMFFDFLEMYWLLLPVPHRRWLVTGDAPVTLFVPKAGGKALFGAGSALPDIQVTFPLSPEKCLFLSRKLVNLKPTPGFVREVNRRTIRNAQRFVIARNHSPKVESWVGEFADTADTPHFDREGMLRHLSSEDTE
jgi:hypothetical protein